MLLPLCRTLLHARCCSDLQILPLSPSYCCPRCQTPMRIIERLTAFQLQREDYRLVAAFDTSIAALYFRSSMCHPAGPAPRMSVHQIWRLRAPSKVSLSADLALQPSSLRQLEFTTTPAECRLPALFGSQRLSKPIARSCQIAAQPLPSYDSVRSAPATTFRRSSALCAGPLPIEICRWIEVWR